MSGTDTQREHFNSISRKYLEGRSSANHLAYKDRLWKFFLRQVADRLPPAGRTTGLEAMCGNAEIEEGFLARFPELEMHAFDVSERMVEAARERAVDRLLVSRHDILRFDSREVYDFVVIIGGLHHIPHHVDAGLEVVRNALKPNGLFLNLEPTHNNFLWRKARERIYRTNELFEESSERGFRLGEYNQLLAKHGFRIVDQTYPGLLGYILYFNPDAFPSLNLGTPGIARGMAGIDIALGRTAIGRFLSFATWTIAVKR